MLDFLMVSTRSTSKGVIEIYPKFIIKKSSDLMIRGGDFYAIWNESDGRWSTEEDDAVRLIDRELDLYAQEHKANFDSSVRVLHLWDAETGMIDKWHKYCQKQRRDDFHMLDETLIFSNTPTNKKDYASKRLPYPLEEGNAPSYEKLISTLYSPEERHKIEWAIGSIVVGDSRKIQKFIVLYGSAGTGKSTVLNIIEKLFEGYCSVFDAKALGSANNAFALEAFKSNPLVAIQHDGDLSRIEDNTRLNSLVSHEMMTVNEKFKSTYSSRFKSFLFMGTNRPVKITDSKSGLLRRLIDVTPSGNLLSSNEYEIAVNQVAFELGPIAYHCKQVYLADTSAYNDYIPYAMLGASNDFYNFMLDSYSLFKKSDQVTVTGAWEMYNTYCNNAKVNYPYTRRLFKEELKSYFREYVEEFPEDGSGVIEHMYGFRSDKFDKKHQKEEPKLNVINFDSETSEFDRVCADCIAQYANDKETPIKKWAEVTTKLSELDTSQLHYVRVPENHIVIDFDITGEDGEKSFEENLKEASKWPSTYAELSKSGKAIHLHYIYTGDPTKLSRLYKENVEVKVFTGNSSLRRKLTKCNSLPIATISSGLPLKGDDKVVNFEGIKSERALRTIIKRNLNKEIHGYTKPSIDFINKALNDAYESGMKYDVSDMRNAVLSFGANSSNNADYCIKLVTNMKFKSDEASDPLAVDDDTLIFYDVEVFPNLFLINWKEQGKGKPVVRMINPEPERVEELAKYNLVGFNCRRYDNHILYARIMGYTNEQLFDLSQRIINGSRDAMFGEAYNISYTDVYDFAATKQSLKKWEIELGIHHQELGLPWDQPVPEELWTKVAEYCDNDVIATEAVFNHLQSDWNARKILAALTGLSVNDTTNALTARFIFGTEKHPQLVYTNLATGEASNPKYQNDSVINAFPGYEYVDGKNMYRGTNVGRGGYVYAEPGMYSDVALLDVASMHPNSIVNMNVFGEHTENFKQLLDIRIAIKHHDYESVRHMFGGKLIPYLKDEQSAKELSHAFKIVINIVYGMTSANFDNPFRDIRNNNNIVALRGALFMRTLQDEVEDKGFTVAHIKTDSIKIPNATPEIIQFVMDFGKKYGYTFEHEATYDRMCLVNDAVYIAKHKDGEWTATGTQFQIPYVFKTLFSKEPIKFDDLCVTKSVKSAIYLDMNEGLPDVSELEAERDKLAKKDPPMTREGLDAEIAEGHNYVFIGKVGQFCPIKPGAGGGLLMRDQNGKYYAVTGSTGYRWLESEQVKYLKKEDDIDRSYFRSLVDDAVDTISQYGDFERFASDDPLVSPWFKADDPDELPWDDTFDKR